MEEFIHVELKFLRLEKYLKNEDEHEYDLNNWENRSEGRRRHNLENKIWKTQIRRREIEIWSGERRMI